MRSIPPWQSYDQMAASGEYGALAPESKETRPREGADEAEFFRAALAGRRRVLDLGTGPGVPLTTLADRVGSLCGLDASPAMLKLAQRSIAASGIGNAGLVRGLAESLPFLAGSFDGVAVSGTLSSLPDPAPALAELARVTAPGAVVATLVWDFRSVLAEGRPRQEQWLRRRGDDLYLEVVRYLTEPYRIASERYRLDVGNELVQALLDDPDLQKGGRRPTDLSPEEVPPEMILDATSEEERQFDPDTLQEAFAQAGFGVIEQRVETSFGVPHVFSVFRRADAR